jgi:transglutaminase-like putative cysteine protease
MRLKISHRTEYAYTSPNNYALQRIRLTPRSCETQRVLSWSVKVDGAQEEVRYDDQFRNDTRLLSAHGAAHSIAVVAEGEVETRDTAGISGPPEGFAPLWLFKAATDLTTPGPKLQLLVRSIDAGGDVDRLHMLMSAIGGAVVYEVGSTNPATSAEEAMTQGKGVCQDHAHIFIAVARLLGFPARYVSGYLMLDDRVDQVAGHAWAEAHVDGLGWVSFDPSNGISPDARYVRLALGRDYRDAAPISGIRLGMLDERLDVRITVEQ